MAISWHAYSGDAYMSADALGACTYYMAIGSHACSEVTYMLAGCM